MEEPGSTPLAPRISAYLIQKFRTLVQSSAKHLTTKANGRLPRFLTTSMQQYKVSRDYLPSSSSGQETGSSIVERCVNSGLMASFGSTEQCSSHVPAKSGILRKYFVQTEQDMALGGFTLKTEVDSGQSSGGSSCDAATIEEYQSEIRSLYPDSEVESTRLSSPAIVESVYSDDTWRQKVKDASADRIEFGNGCDLPAEDAYCFVGTNSFDSKSAVDLDDEDAYALYDETYTAKFSFQGIKRKIEEPTKFFAQKRAKVRNMHEIDASPRFEKEQISYGHARQLASTGSVKSKGHVSCGLVQMPLRCEMADIRKAKQGHIACQQTAADARAAYGEDNALYSAEYLLCANDAIWHNVQLLEDLRGMKEKLRKMMDFLEYQVERSEFEERLWLRDTLSETRTTIWNSFESYLDSDVFVRKLL